MTKKTDNMRALQAWLISAISLAWTPRSEVAEVEDQMQFNRLKRLRLIAVLGSGVTWRLAVIGTVTALLAATSATLAEDWPTRPMTLIVPLAAGGSSDAIARMVAEGLRVELGQPVLVENVGGAGGMLVAHFNEFESI